MAVNMIRRRFAACAACWLLAAPAIAQSTIVLATTTSTQDTGLLDVLLPRFSTATGIKVKAVAVGTGEALAMGRRGDADVLLVHSRKAEDLFMAEGFGALRLDVMHNDFLLIGPADDPAGARDPNADAALARVAAARAPFVSRGDQSGTHARELELWRAAKIDPQGKAWYSSAGQGMGETARIANEKRAYTLIDRGTFLALRSTLELTVISEGDSRLFNPYGVIVVSAGTLPGVHEKEARVFAEWLTKPATQKLIGEFGRDRYGQALFFPDAAAGR
jgi:tungstate transport system substrate-binding protein